MKVGTPSRLLHGRPFRASTIFFALLALGGTVVAGPTTLVDRVLDHERRFSVDGESVTAPNRIHGVRAVVTADAIRMAPRSGADGDWALTLRLAGIGRAGSVVDPGRLAPRVAPDDPFTAQRVGDSLVEWLVNERRGLEHGVTLHNRPGQVEDGPLRVAFEVGGTLAPSLDGARSAAFHDPDGSIRLRYDDLLVLDAVGVSIPARFELADRRLSIEVDDRHARYPLTIDPLINSPDWIGEANKLNSEYGISVASAGDVNGDGFGDIIVGAERYDGGLNDEGAAFVYHGSPTGPALLPTWTVEGEQIDAFLGGSVSGAGDLNGDGYDDIVVGATEYTHIIDDEGAAFVFFGSATGLDAGGTRPAGSPANADWFARGGVQEVNYGAAVSSAGDVNGDGFDDVLIGADEFSNGQSNEGIASVYYGSSTGPGLGGTRPIGLPKSLSTGNADWQGEPDRVNQEYGLALDSGDFNGDGLSDVVVAGYLFDLDQVNVGKVYMYLGATGGLSPTPIWTAIGNQDNGRFGFSVASAGDVNGDGYDDIVVGEDALDDPLSDEGAAYVFYGVPTGLMSVTPGWSVQGEQAEAFMGASVAGVGDFNGDGYDDFLVGLTGFDGGEIDEGAAHLYYGSEFGPQVDPALTFEADQVDAVFAESVAGAGDTNGDGRPDLIIGASEFSRGQLDEGAAFVYFGCDDGDRDGICTDVDNCPDLANPEQIDTDGDTVGDTCDVCLDLDADMVCDTPRVLIEWSGNGEQVYVDFGSPMRYLDNPTDPGLGITWVDENFDDLSWTPGTYGAGYETDGSGALNLIQTPVDTNSRSVYTRAEFNVPDKNAVENLFLGVDYDDGWVAWLNGVEVFRSGEMPPGPPAWNTAAVFSHESSNADEPEFEPFHDISGPGIPLLVDNTNVLAIGAWNVLGASSDLVVVPRLSANRSFQTTSRIRANLSDGPAGNWQSPTFSDAGWETGSFGVGYEFGTGAESLINTEVPDFTKSIFTRTRFSVDPSQITALTISADYDDGWAAWINGAEVYRSPELPAGALEWNSVVTVEHESSNGVTPDYGPPIDITSAAAPVLFNGENLLAVGVWNREAPVGPDLVVVPRLAINEGGLDNCLGLYNPDQSDVDGDGLGDLCDPDADNDGIEDDGDSSGTRGDAPCTGGATATCDDNCPLTVNTDQLDVDGDGIGDLCDACPNDPDNDIDADTRCGDVDNCPSHANVDQADNEGDGIGDVCDPDDDNDAVLDDGDGSGTIGDNPCTGMVVNGCDDNCQFLANAFQEDDDSDLVGNVCDCAPTGAGAWASPAPVTGFVFASSSNLQWSMSAAPGGSSVTYDLLRSTGTDFTLATCLETDDVDLVADDFSSPGAGTAYYYLVRVENSCPTGNASLGFDSNGTPRTGAACP